MNWCDEFEIEQLLKSGDPKNACQAVLLMTCRAGLRQIYLAWTTLLERNWARKQEGSLLALMLRTVQETERMTRRQTPAAVEGQISRLRWLTDWTQIFVAAKQQGWDLQLPPPTEDEEEIPLEDLPPDEEENN
jgi:hypothetical protein